MVVFVLLVALFFVLSTWRPDWAFWIALTLVFDPGGLFAYYFPEPIMGGLKISDLTFVFTMLPLFSPKVSISTFFHQKRNVRVVIFLMLFTVLYHLLVFGFIASDGSLKSLFEVLRYQRLTLVGWLVVIPTYIFFTRSQRLFLRFAVVTSVIIVSAFIISVFTPIELLPLVQFERGLGVEAMRISMMSYGFAFWFVPLVFLLIFLPNMKVLSKKWIYYVGIVIILAVLLTLTRRSILGLFTLFVYAFLLSRYVLFESFSVSIKYIRPLLAMVVISGSIYLVSPDLRSALPAVIESTFTFFSESSSNADGRLTNDIPEHLERFRASPILGDGWDPKWYSNDTVAGGLSANDVPLTAALGMFGLLGVLVYSLIYIVVLKELLRSFKLLRYLIHSGGGNHHTTLMMAGAQLLFLNNFTVYFMSLYGDIIVGEVRVKYMVLVGILFALIDHNKKERQVLS